MVSSSQLKKEKEKRWKQNLQSWRWLKNWKDFSLWIQADVDPHFSRAPPLDRRHSLFICEKLIFEKKSWSRHLFYFYFWRENKTRNKTLKKWLHNFWKSVSLKNPSLSPGIRLPIGKVPLKGSTPLSPIKVSTNKVKGSVAINQLIMDT